MKKTCVISLSQGDSFTMSWSATYVDPVIRRPGEIRLGSQQSSVVVTALDHARLKVAYPEFVKTALVEGDGEHRDAPP